LPPFLREGGRGELEEDLLLRFLMITGFLVEVVFFVFFLLFFLAFLPLSVLLMLSSDLERSDEFGDDDADESESSSMSSCVVVMVEDKSDEVVRLEREPDLERFLF